MHIRVPRNIAEDWSSISKRYGLPVSQILAAALLDIAERGDHRYELEEISETGAIGGVAYDGGRKFGFSEAEGTTSVRAALDEAEYERVVRHLQAADVPLTVARAVALLRLYYLGAATERLTVYNFG